MSIINPIGKSQIKTNFTHYGWFMGVVPIYIKNPYSDDPTLSERDWVPEWWFSFVSYICMFVGDFIDKPVFAISITGEIK